MLCLMAQVVCTDTCTAAAVQTLAVAHLFSFARCVVQCDVLTAGYSSLTLTQWSVLVQVLHASCMAPLQCTVCASIAVSIVKHRAAAPGSVLF